MTQPVKQTRHAVARSGFSNPLTLEIQVDDAAFVKVYADDALLSLGSDYTIDGLGSADGIEITIINGEDTEFFPDTETFAALFLPIYEQGADLSAGGTFGRAFENAIDALARQILSLDDRLRRSLTLPATYADEDQLAFPLPVAGRVLVGNATADGFDNGATLPEIETIVALTAQIDTLTAIAPEIATLAGVEAALNALYGIRVQIASLGAVSASVASLDAIKSPILAVEAFETEIVAAADNMAAILAAPGAATDASNAADLAAQWAGEAEDVEVTSGEYSAFHWSKKAQESAQLSFVSVMDFGAVRDGATDDSAAFVAAQAAAVSAGTKFVRVPAGSYRLGSTVDILSGITWSFEGCVINTNQASLASGIFRANQVNEWAMIGRLVLVGTRASTVATPTTDTQHGLVIVDGDRYLVSGVMAKNLLGRGFYLSGVDVGDTSLRGDRGQFDACSAHYCSTGRYVEAGAGAEYTTWTNWHASGNALADLIGAGNTCTSGGSVTDNEIGVSLVSGSNHGHGNYTGVNINHNTVNVKSLDVANGFTFSGCHLYEGDIQIENSAGVVFDGGILDGPIIATTGAGQGWIYVRNMWCPGGYGAVVISGTAATRILCNNLDGPGRPIAKITNGVLHSAAYRIADSEQTLTQNVLATLLWSDTATNVGGCFNTATGIFTVPTDQGGIYELEWSLIFNGGSMLPTNSYVSLESDDAGGGSFSNLALSLGQVFGTSKLHFSGSAVSSIGGGTQMRLRASIDGTSPTFGDTSGGWYCLLNIKKIG